MCKPKETFVCDVCGAVTSPPYEKFCADCLETCRFCLVCNNEALEDGENLCSNCSDDGWKVCNSCESPFNAIVLEQEEDLCAECLRWMMEHDCEGK